ncbi:MAG: hypothetical protein J0I77_00525 [Rudaea sp.]|uniref:DUF2778 domain-containing protein n=1 Tax=unclassified Rudaea TaxID=2627037 RepID=UPI0010F9F521|nr:MULTISPECIES: DUF2778 domain-containing protein [unclassified Rudaea]MBN8884177.1 hypothetical protein [Rudaea sp.]
MGNTFAYVGSNPPICFDPVDFYHFTYSIADHSVDCTTGRAEHPIFHGSNWASGNSTDPNHLDCQNNPQCQDVPNHGPAPAGSYTIGPPTAPGGGRRNLRPNAGTNMHGRDGMQSHGCINTANRDRDEYNQDMALEEGHNTVTVQP